MIKTRTKFLRPDSYAESRGISLATLRHWMRQRTIPFLKVGRMILIDPEKADESLTRFEQKEKIG